MTVPVCPTWSWASPMRMCPRARALGGNELEGRACVQQQELVAMVESRYEQALIKVRHDCEQQRVAIDQSSRGEADGSRPEIDGA